MPELIRTSVLLLLALASILCVALPPNYFLWQIKIVVSEFSNIPFVLALVVFLLPGFNRNFWLWPQLVLLASTILLCFYPVVGAYKIGDHLSQDLDKAFGKAQVEQQPFSYWRMFVPAPGAPKPETLTYYSDKLHDLQLDFYPAQGKQKAPVVIVIHGGGWDGGDRTQMDNFDRELATLGYNVAAIEYSLAPKFQSPQQVWDVKNCIEFLKINAGKLKIDASQFVLLGRSAGGQIALQSAYSLGLPEIKGVVAFYSPADMVWGYSLSVDNAILKSKTLITQYLGGKLEDIPQKYEEATAMTHVTPNSPPTLLIHGQKDNMVAYGHNLHLIEKLVPNRVPHYLLSVPWATHGADYHLNGPTGQLSSFAVQYFLKTRFSSTL